MGSVESYETATGKRYRVRYRTPDRRQTDKRGFRTKREAEDYLSSVEVSKLRGDWVDSTRSRATVREVAQTWLDSQVQVKPTTRSGYRHALDKHVLPAWASVRLVDITHSDVQKWVSRLADRLGPSAVRQTHRVFSSVLNYALRDGRIPRNPAAGVNLPRLTSRRHGYLTHAQVRELASECGEYEGVVLMLAYTGLRWGEFAALRVRSVDVRRRRLDVAEAVSEPRGLIVWGTPKTHERRSVPFPALLDPILERQIRGKGRDELLFAGPNGAVLRSGNFRQRVFFSAVARVRERDGADQFPALTPHDLRHTAASLAIAAGANVKAVQRMLGHASAAMTLDVYADLFEDDLDRVAHALNEQAMTADVGKTWARSGAS